MTYHEGAGCGCLGCRSLLRLCRKRDGIPGTSARSTRTQATEITFRTGWECLDAALRPRGERPGFPKTVNLVHWGKRWDRGVEAMWEHSVIPGPDWCRMRAHTIQMQGSYMSKSTRP